MSDHNPDYSPTSTVAAGPITERIDTLDTIRGVAVLGILPMNALSFGIEAAGYFNMPAAGISQPLDWVFGMLAMVFLDQKMMALFSLLFGVGVVIFADRAASNGRRVVGLSLWRFSLLACVGLVHITFWDGDVLLLYGVCAPFVLFARRLPVWTLWSIGGTLALLGTVLAPVFQWVVGSQPDDLGSFWFVGYDSFSPLSETWFIMNAATRALGLMLIGVALYRVGIVQGQRANAFYVRLAAWGIGVGTAVTSAGMVWRVTSDWSAERAITGTIPTGLGTIPMALGYMALIILLSRNGGRIVGRLQRAGQMALTNYLTQTMLGLVTLTWLLYDVDVTRTMIALWVVGVWVLQLWWSTLWLRHYRFGPFEWAWRCATYRSWQPLRRAHALR